MTNTQTLDLTVKQMAKYLQISEDLAYTLCHRQDFPAFRIGRAIRINRRALEEWVDRQSGKEF